jgi:hypothetical protein
MKLFESITIQFVTINNIPIENLIVSITVLANSKNDYSLGFLKTDSDGKLIVFRSMIENEIKKAMSEFIMDYASSINDCKDWIIIEVENISELETRLKNIEKYYPENAEKLSKLMNTCSNKSYKTLNVEHKIESSIKITVQDI